MLRDNGPAAQAFMDTARRLLGEEVPFRALEDAQGLLGVLKRLFGGR